MANKFKDSHPNGLKVLEESISTHTDVHDALKGVEGERTTPPATSTTAEVGSTPNRSRTVAQPDFDGDTVPVFGSNLTFHTLTTDDFSASKTFFGWKH